MTPHSILGKKTVRLCVVVTLLMACLPVAVAGLEVSYVGTIHEGLTAPTSLDAGTDHIAALQPYHRQILVFTPQGTVSRRVDIMGETHGLARLNNSVYLFCDRGRRHVRAVDVSDGSQWPFIDTLEDPVDVLVNGDACYVLDSGSHRIAVADFQGRILRQFRLSPGADPPMRAPASMAFDAVRNVFHVFDQVTSRVNVYGSTGEHLGSYCYFGAEAGRVTRGGGLVCDADGYVYLVDRYQGRVSVFDPEWRFVLNVETGALAGKPLSVPTGIAVDPEGTVYVASTEDNCIHVFFLDKNTVPEGELVAIPLFPKSGNKLSARDVELAIRLAAVTGDGNNLAADFRIVTAEAPEVLVDEMMDVKVKDLGTDDLGRLVGTATWRPEKALVPDIEYLWQARARVDDRVGQWFEPVSFSTYPPDARFNLEANHPNPFNPSTTIAFTVPAVREVVLTIYDLKGTRVWSKTLLGLEAGRHKVTWDGTNTSGNSVASGVYFYQMRSENFEQSRKMVLIK